MFIGIIGEYIGVIHTYVQNAPSLLEKERIGFDNPEDTDNRLALQTHI